MRAIHPTPISVHVRAASLDYAGATLFRDLSLDLTGGQWTVLLGPSGVGKTTLLKMIAGIADSWPTSRIETSDGTPLKGRIAYMAQTDLLFPWLTVLDNVTVGARLRGQDQDRDRGQELLAAVGLADKAGALPATLSGGQRQRAALARTLMEDRPVVLMDEPFSALDAITREQIQTLAVRLLAGRTVLLVTHDPVEALQLGHCLHVLSGKPAQMGPAIVPGGEPMRDAGSAAVTSLRKPLMQELLSAYAAGGRP